MEFIYDYAFLIVAVIMSLILVAIVASMAIQKGKINKALLIASLVNVLIIAVFIGIYNAVIIKYTFLQVIFISYYVLLTLSFVGAMIIVLHISNQKGSNYDQLITSLNHTSWNVFYLCDRNDNIKEISTSFLTELGMKEADVIGKKAFDVFDKTIRFTKINDADITNKTLREYYRKFSRSSQNGDEYQREIYFQNCNGQTVVFNLVEKPLFVGNKYCGRLNIGQKKTDQVLASIERELVEKNQDLEAIQYKFIAALELMEEGIFFNDLDTGLIWGNDILVRSLGLTDNTISMNDYLQKIHPEDVAIYRQVLESVTKTSPHYSLTYRLRVGDKYEFIKENGKRIFEDTRNNVILGFAQKLNSRYYQKTDINEIDLVKSTDDLLNDLNSLYRSHRLFQLVCLNLTSLPEINSRCGRQVGNLIMGEYLKKIRLNFLTESSEIYRADDLVFYFTITDARKIDFFKRGLSSDANAMNLKMNYGNITAELRVNLGIAEATDDGISPEELIKNCNMAINTTLSPNYNTNYAYYKDIKGVRKI